MNSNRYKGFKAYIPHTTKSGKKTTRKGVVVSHHPYEPGAPESITIRLDNGKTEKVYVGLPRLEPKKTPKPWQKILLANTKAKVPGIQHIGVCVSCHSSPQTTTLFDRRTGERLGYTTTSIEGAEIRLWENDIHPSESKPNLLDSQTEYHVGDVVIEMEATHY